VTWPVVGFVERESDKGFIVGIITQSGVVTMLPFQPAGNVRIRRYYSELCKLFRRSSEPQRYPIPAPFPKEVSAKPTGGCLSLKGREKRYAKVRITSSPRHSRESGNPVLNKGMGEREVSVQKFIPLVYKG
jgi:hypothetical protein